MTPNVDLVPHEGALPVNPLFRDMSSEHLDSNGHARIGSLFFFFLTRNELQHKQEEKEAVTS